jgi:hypothetical protein
MALNNHDIAPAERGDVLKTWVLYENPMLCNRALLLLHRVASNLEGAGQVACAICRLDCLADSQLSKTLAREAQSADIILVATHADRELPEAFNDWISRWLATKAPRPTALALLLDTNEPQSSTKPRLSAQLEEVARLGGLTFLTAGGGLPLTAIEGGLSYAFAGRSRAAIGAL